MNENIFKNNDFLKSRNIFLEIKKNIAEIEENQNHSQSRQIEFMGSLIKAGNQISSVFEIIIGIKDLENYGELRKADGFLALAAKFQKEAEISLSVIVKLQNKILSLAQKIEFEANQVAHNLMLVKNAIKTDWPFSAALLAQDIQKQAEDLILQIESTKIKDVANIVRKAKGDALLIGEAIDKIKNSAIAEKYFAKMESVSLIEAAQVSQALASQSGQTFDQQQVQCFQTTRRMRQKIGDLDGMFNGL